MPRNNSIRTRILARRIGLSRGVYTRVARRLGVSVPTVSRVANGLKTSRRVEAALIAEQRRIERELEKFDRESAA